MYVRQQIQFSCHCYENEAALPPHNPFLLGPEGTEVHWTINRKHVSHVECGQSPCSLSPWSRLVLSWASLSLVRLRAGL